MNKLRPLLLRPEMRAIVGQTRRSFDLRRVFTERKILLVNLSKGLLGPETSALLGSLVVSQLWQAVLGRAAIAPERRHPVFVYVDEFQDYMHLPLDFADALAQARGLGVGFVARPSVHAPTRAGHALGGAGQRPIAGGLPAARARTPGSLPPTVPLAPEDFQSLGAFQCYCQLVAKAAVQPWCSAAPCRRASRSAIRQWSGRPRVGLRRRSGRGRSRPAQALCRPSADDDDDLTPRRRDSGSTE